MTDDNKKENSIIAINSTDLARVGNSIDITNKIIKEYEERSVAENFTLVKIGNQEWMTRNLEVENYSNGDPIPQVSGINDFKNLKIGAWCYNIVERDSDKNIEIIESIKCSKIYNWYAINDERGFAPTRFKIPNKTDWKNLFEFTYQMMISENPKTEAIPEFNRIVDHLFVFINNLLLIQATQPSHYLFWTSTEINDKEAVYVNFTRVWSPEFFLHSSESGYGSTLKNSGYSIRCIKNK